MEAVEETRSWLHQFRVELGMRMEHRGWVIWYLIVEKALQGVFFMALGLWLVFARHHISNDVARVVQYFDLDEARGFFGNVLFGWLNEIAGFQGSRFMAIGIGAMAHASLELIESVGLFLRRRWAEYLVVLATGFFIPLEVYEVLRRITLFRTGVLVVNVAIVIYLVRQKELFQFQTDVSPGRA